MCCPAVQHITASAGSGRQGQSIKPGKKKGQYRYWCATPLFILLLRSIRASFFLLFICCLALIGVMNSRGHQLTKNAYGFRNLYEIRRISWISTKISRFEINKIFKACKAIQNQEQTFRLVFTKLECKSRSHIKPGAIF